MEIGRIFFILLFLLTGCSHEPTRPMNVPAEAFWVGGADGGVYILCNRKPDITNAYYCKVTNDFNGAVWKEEVFIIENGKPDFDTRDKQMYWSYDGDIVLRDGRTLVLQTQANESSK